MYMYASKTTEQCRSGAVPSEKQTFVLCADNECASVKPHAMNTVWCLIVVLPLRQPQRTEKRLDCKLVPAICGTDRNRHCAGSRQKHPLGPIWVFGCLPEWPGSSHVLMYASFVMLWPGISHVVMWLWSDECNVWEHMCACAPCV